MPMISYAQNAEDVLLRRIFGEQSAGLYVDVGAYDPVSCSITKHFYDRGWRGVNVEPAPTSYARIAEARPRDTNVNVGISNRSGELRFFEFPREHAGLNTFAEEEAKKHRAAGYTYIERIVQVITLRELCERHVQGPIDFMSIDVEGHEREVIEGGDFRRFRPRALVVEATQPKTTITTHQRWEPLLLEAGYVYATFDGLNRYYLREEDAHLAPRLQVPANSFDDYVPYVLQQQIDELRDEVSRIERENGPLVRLARGLERLARHAGKVPRRIVERLL